MADAIEFDFIGKDDVSNVLREIASSMEGVVASIDQVGRASGVIDSAFSDMNRIISEAAMTFIDLRDAMSTMEIQTGATVANLKGLQAALADDIDELNVGASAFGEFANGQKLSADAAQALNDMILSQGTTLADLNKRAADSIIALDGMSEAERAAVGDTSLLRSALVDIVTASNETIQGFTGMQAAGRTTEEVMQGMADTIKATADASMLAGDTISKVLGDRLVMASTAAAKAIGVLRQVNGDLAASEDQAASQGNIESDMLNRIADAATRAAMSTREASLAAGGGGLAGAVGTATGAEAGLITSLANGIDHLGKNAMELGINAAILDSFAAHTIGTGITYQKWMAIVGSLTGSAGMSIQQMSNTLLANAPAWRQTPADLAQALYYVRSAGFVGADSMEILKTSSMAAVGGLGSVVDIAKAVTTMLVDYGVKGSQAARVTEIFLNGVVAGKTNVEEFANALGKVMPTASSMGIGMDTVVTALAAMTHTGLSAAVASTYLRSTITRLDGQFSAVNSAAKGYNITLDQTKVAHLMQSGPMGFIDTLKYLWTQAHDSAMQYSKDPAVVAQRTNDAFSKMVGGIRAGSGAYALLANDAGNYKYALSIVDGQHGVLAAHFAQMSNTIGGAWLGLKASLATLYTQFVVTFGPQITQLLNKLAGEAQRLTKAIQDHPALMKGIAGAVVAIAAAVNGAAVAALGAMMLKFTGLTPLLGLFGKHMDGIKKVSEGGAKEISGFGKIMQSVFGSWGSMIIGPLQEGEHRATGFIGMIHRGGVAGRQFGDALLHPVSMLRTIGGAFKGVLDVFSGGFVGALEKVSGGFFKLVSADISLPNIINLVRNSFLGLGRAALGLIPAIMSIAGAALPIIGILLLIAGVVVVVVLAFTTFRTQTMAALQPLLAMFKNVFGTIAAMVHAAIFQIQMTWMNMQDQIRPAMIQFLGAVKQMGPVWQVLGTVIKIVAGIIIGALTGLITGFIHALPFIINVFTGIITIITNIAAIIVAIFTGQWGKIPGLVLGIFGAIGKIVINALAAVGAFVAGAIHGIIAWFNMLTHGALSGVLGFVNGIVHWFTHLADVLVGHSIIPNMINAIVHFITGLPGKILGIIAGLVGTVIGHFTRLGTQVGANMLKLGSNVIHAASSLPGPVGAVFGLLSRTIDNHTRIAQLTSDMHMNQMKAHTLMHTAQMEAGAAQHARSMAQQLLQQAAHTKDGHVRHMLEMKAQSLLHVAALHQGAAVHAAQMAHEVQAKAAQEAAQVKAEHDRMKGGVIGAVSSMVSTAVGNIASGMGSFVSHVASGAGQVLSKIQALPGQIVGALSSLGGQLAGVAGNAMDSMAGAIRDAAGRLGQAAAGVVGGIIHAAKDALGIKSPSTVFLEIGHHTMLGMAHGIATGGALAVDATHDSTQRVIAAAKRGIATGQQALIATGGQGVAGARGGGAQAPGGGGGDIHLHLEGGLGAGLQLLNPTDRRRFAQQVAKELSLNTGIQGIQPLGYSGRGTI